VRILRIEIMSQRRQCGADSGFDGAEGVTGLGCDLAMCLLAKECKTQDFALLQRESQEQYLDLIHHLLTFGSSAEIAFRSEREIVDVLGEVPGADEIDGAVSRDHSQPDR